MELSVEQNLPATDGAMQQRILNLCAMSINRAQAYLKKFIDLWKERGQEISGAIRAAFPDPRGVTPPKTDPDPARSDATPAPATLPADRPAAF